MIILCSADNQIDPYGFYQKTDILKWLTWILRTLIQPSLTEVTLKDKFYNSKQQFPIVGRYSEKPTVLFVIAGGLKVITNLHESQ